MTLIETLQWNIDFIQKETDAIDSSAKIKTRVHRVCDYSSDAIKQYAKDNDVDELVAKLEKAFTIFDDLIKELEGNPKEESMWMLLITHVADMIALLPRNSKEGK